MSLGLPALNAALALRRGEAHERFMRNICAQGGSEAALNRYLRATFRQRELTARQEGYVQMDSSALRRALTTVNERVQGRTDLAGVTLLADSGEHAPVGMPLVRVRCREELATSVEETFVREIAAAVTTVEQSPGLVQQTTLIVHSEGGTEIA
jgi:thymidine phosphorylase